MVTVVIADEEQDDIDIDIDRAQVALLQLVEAKISLFLFVFSWERLRCQVAYKTNLTNTAGKCTGTRVIKVIKIIICFIRTYAMCQSLSAIIKRR